MEHLIDKDALVAEIEKFKKSHDNWSCMGKCFHKEYENLLSFIDILEAKEIGADLGDPKGDKSAKYIIDTETLEVKEVDLEAELNKWRHNHFHGRRDKNASGEYLERISQLELAKHFFELGLRVNNHITAADRGTAEEIIISLKRVENDYRIDHTKEIEWVRNKVKKGKEL